MSESSEVVGGGTAVAAAAPEVSTTPQAPTNQKIKFPPKNKNRYKVCQKHLICTPPFCDGMPKGNQNSSSKGGGDEELRNRAKSAHNPLISS